MSGKDALLLANACPGPRPKPTHPGYLREWGSSVPSRQSCGGHARVHRGPLIARDNRKDGVLNGTTSMTGKTRDGVCAEAVRLLDGSKLGAGV